MFYCANYILNYSWPFRVVTDFYENSILNLGFSDYVFYTDLTIHNNIFHIV